MACIETAIEARKDSSNDFEGLRYISGARLGDFYTEMNVIIKNCHRLMPAVSSKDRLTLSYFAQRIGVSHLVSNKPSCIKKEGVGSVCFVNCKI